MSEQSARETKYHFVIVPKLTFEAPFFFSVGLGCQGYVKQELLGIAECHYRGYAEADAVEQARVIRELITDPSLHGLDRIPDGISIAVLDEEITGAAIDFVYEAGVPVITFDSDAPTSKRQAFVSTDNYAFGLELGKVLDQLNPNGGNFGMITANGPNLLGRLNGVRDRLFNDPLHPTRWTEVDYSPLNCENNVTLANELMHQYAADPNIQAIIPVGGWPMFNPVLWKEFVEANRNVFTVVADSVDVQIKLMGEGFVNGLVGQLPYQMGEFSARELYNINEGQLPAGEEVLGTHMLEILRVPLQLPALTVDQQHLGSVVILGYVLFGVVAILSLTILAWVWKNSKRSVIRASQPAFLGMICVGTLVFGASILPLTVDDGNASQKAADTACMVFPWFLFIGFSISFSALFSKQWRVLKLQQSAERLRRVKVTKSDVMAPFIALMTVNVITLICWTLIAPLKYVRQPRLGTDDWNRVFSTYGSCNSVSDAKGGSIPYIVILASVNGCMLILANVYAYRSRKVHTEFSESRCIALVNASMLQAALIGLPVAFLVSDQPEVYFLILSSFIFVVCMAILVAIFYPKFQALGKKASMPRRESSTAGSGGMRFSIVGSGADAIAQQRRRSDAAKKKGMVPMMLSSGNGASREEHDADSRAEDEAAPASVEDIMKLIQDESNDVKKKLNEILSKALGLRQWELRELSTQVVYAIAAQEDEEGDEEEDAKELAEKDEEEEEKQETQAAGG